VSAQRLLSSPCVLRPGKTGAAPKSGLPKSCRGLTLRLALISLRERIGALGKERLNHPAQASQLQAAHRAGR
jgi:hypothetical protein